MTREEFLERIGARTKRIEIVPGMGECWLWLGATAGQSNYGQIWLDGGRVYVHRLSYETFIRPIPDGLDVLHTCDCPRCWRAEHLFVGTASVNAIDSLRKGRWTSAKPTEDDVREIRARLISAC
jgi:hypothetical protein